MKSAFAALRAFTAVVVGSVVVAQEVRIALPEPIAGDVAAAVREAFASAEPAMSVRIVAREALRDRADARAAVLVAAGPDLFALQRDAAFAEWKAGPEVDPAMRVSRDGRVAMPWSLGYVVCSSRASELAADGAAPRPFERLALAYGLGDGLRIAAPAWDRGPWILSMHETLRAGGGDSAVFGVWTAIDARIGSYGTDYRAMVDGLGGSPDLALVIPEPTAARDASLVRMPQWTLPVALPVGIAVLEGVGREAAIAAVLRILATSSERAIRERAGLRLPADGDADVPAESVEPAFAHFARNIQGQGKRVEQIADWLDLASLALLLLVLLVFWIQKRKGESK